MPCPLYCISIKLMVWSFFFNLSKVFILWYLICLISSLVYFYDSLYIKTLYAISMNHRLDCKLFHNLVRWVFISIYNSYIHELPPIYFSFFLYTILFFTWLIYLDEIYLLNSPYSFMFSVRSAPGTVWS